MITFFFQKDIHKVTHKWICHPGILSLEDILFGPITPAPGGNYLYTKKSWEKVGGYSEINAGLHEAWGFALKQIASGSKFYVVPNTFYYHRYGHNSLYARESKKLNESSRVATQLIKPFMHLINENDAKYILSEEGQNGWFDRLSNHPIRTKRGRIGRAGTIKQNFSLKHHAFQYLLRTINRLKLN